VKFGRFLDTERLEDDRLPLWMLTLY